MVQLAQSFSYLTTYYRLSILLDLSCLVGSFPEDVLNYTTFSAIESHDDVSISPGEFDATRVRTTLVSTPSLDFTLDVSGDSEVRQTCRQAEATDSLTDTYAFLVDSTSEETTRQLQKIGPMRDLVSTRSPSSLTANPPLIR